MSRPVPRSAPNSAGSAQSRSNIGTDLLIKVLRGSGNLAVAAMVGIDPASDGLARAGRLGVATTAEGVDGLVAMPGFDAIEIVFDATSARAHTANIDEFTETTSAAIEQVGGAARGKAIIILNPAEPPLMMRDTVFCLVAAPDPAVHAEIRASIEKLVADVAAYVPGYRLKQQVQITPIPDDQPVGTLLSGGAERATHQVSVFLEVEGAAHYLPAYAENLDIMTSAALRVAEMIAARKAGA
ncbi:MAG: hypothetical protein HOV68_04965 [Streptomycetaceae bacterium]|nr:hypothetical protein [Streptomycetaceae bacterium]